jgi:hypothetical protein
MYHIAGKCEIIFGFTGERAQHIACLYAKKPALN